MKWLALSLVLLSSGWNRAAAGPEQWLADIARFEDDATLHPPQPGGVVFVGSSSIRLWTTLAQDFPDVRPINRGFGGSELADSVYYADRIVLPCQPRLVVLYAGDNDIRNGKTPERVLMDFQAFRAKIHAAQPRLEIIFLSIKECPARAQWRDQVRKANQLIAAECARQPHCTFVDVASALLQPDGDFRAELFRADGTHLQPAGYAIWTRILTPYLVAPPRASKN